jgi:hypothetical protein
MPSKLPKFVQASGFSKTTNRKLQRLTTTELLKRVRDAPEATWEYVVLPIFIERMDLEDFQRIYGLEVQLRMVTCTLTDTDEDGVDWECYQINYTRTKA